MEDNIKVLQLLSSLEIGGAQTLVKDILQNVNKKNDIYCELLAFKGGNLINKKEKYSFNYNICQSKNFLKKLICLFRYIQQRKINIIQVHSGINVLLVKIVSFLIFKRLYIIRTYHGLEVNNSLKKRLIFLLCNRFNNLNHIFVSETTKQYFLHQFPFLIKRNTFVIYNGIDFKALEINSQKTPNSIYPYLNKSVLLGGMVANFNTPSKDHLTVCRALSQIINYNSNIHFFFTGEKSKKKPELYDKCYNYCEKNNLLNNIHFIGSQINVGSILKNLNFYIQASHRETFGISVAEAMYFGLPCFLSNIPAFKEISDKGKNAIFFEKNNPNDLLDKFQNYLSSENRLYYQNMGKKASEYVQSNYNIKNHIENLENIYKSCLK